MAATESANAKKTRSNESAPRAAFDLSQYGITVEDVQSVPQGLWSWRTVGEVMRPSSPELFVPPDASMMQALELMVRTGYDRLVVIDAGKPAGLVTRSALAQFLELHKA